MRTVYNDPTAVSCHLGSESFKGCVSKEKMTGNLPTQRRSVAANKFVFGKFLGKIKKLRGKTFLSLKIRLTHTYLVWIAAIKSYLTASPHHRSDRETEHDSYHISHTGSSCSPAPGHPLSCSLFLHQLARFLRFPRDRAWFLVDRMRHSLSKCGYLSRKLLFSKP